MPYVGSHLWNLRQTVGSRLLLVPGAQILVIDEFERVLLQQDLDYGRWGLPAGACEDDSTFASTAIDELREETGLEVTEANLVPFASLSDPAVHILRYPNGDITHCFAICFEARTWSGMLRPEPCEVRALEFFPMSDLPAGIHPPTVVVLEMLLEYQRTGRFQAR